MQPTTASACCVTTPRTHQLPLCVLRNIRAVMQAGYAFSHVLLTSSDSAA